MSSNFSDAVFSLGLRVACAEQGLPMPQRKPCEFCSREAWFFENDYRDGRLVSVFKCADGHLNIVTTTPE